jgi:hypothetical protein
VAGNDLIFVFQIAETGEFEIVYHLKPAEAGSVHGWISLVGGQSLDFNQIIYL